jgi:flagellar biosynthetic protein FliO
MPEASLINSSLIMFVVVAFLGVVLFFVKRLSSGRGKNNNGIQMQVVSKLSLQPKVNLYVVKTGGRMIMLGVSDKNVSLLGDLTQNKDKSLEQAANALAQETLGVNHAGQIVKTKPTDPKPTQESLSFSSFLMSLFKKSGNN